jgi:hypothetical protein
MGAGAGLKKREQFLAILKQTGNVAEASRLMKISPNLPYTWKRQSPVFTDAFAIAQAEGHEVLADRLERALTTRATDGFTEAVFYQGKKVGEHRLYSDTAAIVMLKSLRPGRFVEQMIGIGVSGQQVVVNVRSFASLPSVPSGALSASPVMETVAPTPNPAQRED